MAAMKPRTGDGPLEVTKEGRGYVMRVPLEGGGRLVVELNGVEAIISSMTAAERRSFKIIDGSLYNGTEGHERFIHEADGALMVGTTAILGFMVTDSWLAMKALKQRLPDMPAIIGGWFASVKPDLMLETGLYECVVIGQGELIFRDVVNAIDSGAHCAQPSIASFCINRKLRMAHTKTWMTAVFLVGIRSAPVLL